MEDSLKADTDRLVREMQANLRRSRSSLRVQPHSIAVALSALVVASFVASIVATEILGMVDAFGVWALVFLIWPTVLYVASRRSSDYTLPESRQRGASAAARKSPPGHAAPE